MATPPHEPRQKLESTPLPPPDLETATDEIHEEALMDEAV